MRGMFEETPLMYSMSRSDSTHLLEEPKKMISRGGGALNYVKLREKDSHEM